MQSQLKLSNRLSLLSQTSYSFFQDSSLCFCSLFLGMNLNTPSLLPSPKFDSFRHCLMFQNNFHAFFAKLKDFRLWRKTLSSMTHLTVEVHICSSLLWAFWLWELPLFLLLSRNNYRMQRTERDIGPSKKKKKKRILFSV